MCIRDRFKGYEDGSFQPKGNITRAEVSAIVYRVYTQDEIGRAHV